MTEAAEKNEKSEAADDTAGRGTDHVDGVRADDGRRVIAREVE